MGHGSYGALEVLGMVQNAALSLDGWSRGFSRILFQRTA
jgi:hypothetical protein